MIRKDHQRAFDVIDELILTDDPDALVTALLHMIDTALGVGGVHRDGRPRRIRFVDPCCGTITYDASAVHPCQVWVGHPSQVWVGQLVNARISSDMDTFAALLLAAHDMPHDEWTLRIMGVVHHCANVLVLGGVVEVRCPTT